MGVFFAAPDANVASSASKLSCHSGRRKKKSGSMSATVAVGGTLPAWSHFIMPSGLFAYL